MSNRRMSVGRKAMTFGKNQEPGARFLNDPEEGDFLQAINQAANPKKRSATIHIRSKLINHIQEEDDLLH